MNALLLLETLASRGAVVSFDGATLWVKPREVLTDELRGEVRRLKPELVSLLEHGDRFAEVTPPAAHPAPRVPLDLKPQHIARVSRRLAYHQWDMWAKMNGAQRLQFAVCVALLDQNMDVPSEWENWRP